VSEYVKFTYDRATSELAPFSGLADLNACRRKLRELQLIGIDSNGVCFGNLSVRDDATKKDFYITGSATGGLSELTLANCAKVVAYDFERNSLRYEGYAVPSSESLTHAAIYESDGSARAVIHCHDSKFWLRLLDRAPTTSKAVEYGTAEMAHEIRRLFETSDVHQRKIFVMGGHEGGIVTFGRNLEEAFAISMHERNEAAHLQR
jgi:ribulose-5-phosphate 4-epimerase/fuculose-1-phosphate aldolase